MKEGGGTNFNDGYLKGFQIIYDSQGEELSTCRNALLFLTDGQAGSPAELVKGYLETQCNTELFFYTLGTGADTSVAENLSCNYGIMYKHIPDGGDLRGAMSNYYEYFAMGQSRAGTIVRWSPPYMDILGTGPLMPACSPLYNTRYDPPPFLGVLCIDISGCDLYTQFRSNSIINVLKQHSKKCVAWQMNISDLEILRIKTNSHQCKETKKIKCTQNVWKGSS